MVHLLLPKVFDVFKQVTLWFILIISTKSWMVVTSICALLSKSWLRGVRSWPRSWNFHFSLFMLLSFVWISLWGMSLNMSTSGIIQTLLWSFDIFHLPWSFWRGWTYRLTLKRRTATHITWGHRTGWIHMFISPSMKSWSSSLFRTLAWNAFSFW